MKYTCQCLLLAMLCLLLAACSGTDLKPKNPAELYFLEGEKQFEKELYSKAITSWEMVRDTFYSPELSMLAELKIAEAYYITKQYAEAATTFGSFIAKHPDDFRAASAYFRMGLSYYKQILSPDRDQTSTQNALRSFKEFSRLYPDNPKTPEAKNLILRCRSRLAEHEVYVGLFYLKQKKYSSAINRFEGILKAYPEYYFRDEAYFYLGSAYMDLGLDNDAKSYLNKLIQEFPNSKFTDESRELLEKLETE